MSERHKGRVRAPEFPPGREWLNVARPPTLASLRGKVVLLDFWTFCCINCMHVLPELKKLEARFPRELVVIGVHSAKFDAEKDTFNIRQAVMRYDVRHPVVNDHDFVMWRAYATRAWPTVVIIDPDGYVIGAHSGEFDGDQLGDVLAEIISDLDAKGKIDRTPYEVALEKQKQPEMLLSFPGKVLADAEGDRLFVADTDHHQIALFRLSDGARLATFGAGEPGFVDGEPNRARFHAPQGMALHGDALYVADTENHAVRKIALGSGYLTTAAGMGKQARPLPQEGPGRSREINSPWDLLMVDDRLYIAMAGSHQLWRLNLRSGDLEHFAGDGHEALVDGSRREARLAQPSGLAWDGQRLWFADSETSSVRSVEGEGPAAPVQTWIGHGLFQFGDVDGGRQEARLQHPLGVAWGDGVLYVADSYNNRIKVLDPRTGVVRAFAGSGEPGLNDGSDDEACFWEPGGLSYAAGKLYVADTNNHAIREVNTQTGAVRTLPLDG